MTVLGRSGRFDAASDLAHAMRDGWAASVAMTKCDVAFAEDTSAVFSSGAGQQHATKGILLPPHTCTMGRVLPWDRCDVSTVLRRPVTNLGSA